MSDREDWEIEWEKQLSQAKELAEKHHAELRKIQHVARLSEETECFAADVWMGGRKVGTAENDGHGGETNVCVQGLSHEDNRLLTTWVDEEIERYLKDKDARRITNWIQKHVKANRLKGFCSVVCRSGNKVNITPTKLPSLSAYLEQSKVVGVAEFWDLEGSCQK